MEFEGKMTFDGKNSKITSTAFDVAKKPADATHLRIKGTNEFIEISDELIIKRRKDSSGNPTNEQIHFSEITQDKNSEFVCVRKGVESVIEGQFYTQVVYMKKSDKGSYYRCDDGVYVHKDEIQIPAYKRVKIDNNSQLKGPVHDGELYVEQQIAIVKTPGVREGVPVIISKENKHLLTRKGDDWFFDGKECIVKKGVDTREYVKYVLLDGNLVVDVKKLTKNADGQWVVNGIGGRDLVIGQKNVALDKPFVQIQAVDIKSAVVQKDAVLTFSPRNVKNSTSKNQYYSWRENAPDPNGLISVKNEDDYLYCNYVDGRKVYYFKYGYKLAPQQLSNIRRYQDVEIYRVKDIKYSNDSSTVKYDFEQVTKVDKNELNSQKDLDFNGFEEIKYYPAGDKNIQDIKWDHVDGVDVVVSYTMNKVLFKDIVWDGRKIKSCKVVYNKNGKETEEEITNIYSSKFRNLVIECTQIDKIEDVVTNKDGTVSFKIGNYKIKDAIIENGVVGKCKLQINDGTLNEIDLSTDSRFEQLRLILKEHNIEPLVQSKLYEKKDGKYVQIADVVQTEALTDVLLDEDGNIIKSTRNNGVAGAKIINSVSQAREEQEKFKSNPFKTIVIDEKNKNRIHTISDFNTTYEGAADFEHSNDILIDIIGKDKIEVKNGELKIDSKKEDAILDDMVVCSAWLCSNPISFVIGLPVLMGTVAFGIYAPLRRAIKKQRILRMDINKYKEKVQDNAAKNCQKNINKLVAECERELKAYKKLYSQKEFEQKAKEVRENFRFKYRQEMAKMQFVGGGTIQSEFDAGKKTKLTKHNTLAFLQYIQSSNELHTGREDRYERQNEYIEKINNIQENLRKENKALASKGLPAISEEDYRKQLAREYNASRFEWGGIEDKLRAFQETPEYLKVDRKTQKKLLEEKRKQLQKEISTLKVERVTFKEKTNKKGQPVIAGYTQSGMAYFEYIDQMIFGGEIKNAKKFSFDFYDKLSEEEKERYTVSDTLSQGVVRRANNVKQREANFDKERSLRISQKIEQTQQKLSTKVSQLSSEIEQGSKTASYEDLIILKVKNERRIKQLQIAYEKSGNLAEVIPYSELDEKAVKRIETASRDGQVAITKMEIQLEQARQKKESEYKKQVETWARDEFISVHKTEYLDFINDKFTKVVKGKKQLTANSKVVDAAFMEYMETSSNKESIEREMDTYRVKNNIEESASAEVYCSENEEDYKKFVEERKAHDLSEEMAKCYYYAHCKKQNPVEIEKFKQKTRKKREEKLRERVEQDNLPKHEKKKELARNKGKKQSKESEKTSAVAAAPAPAPTIGLTA